MTGSGSSVGTCVAETIIGLALSKKIAHLLLNFLLSQCH